MLVEIVHINGDEEDINSRYHNPELYQKFIEDLRGKIRRAYEAGATIVYQPNLGFMPRDLVQSYFTPESEYKTRVSELREKLPFLNSLEEISLTLLPDGLYAPSYANKIDQLIAQENSGLVIVGGKYTTACVAAITRDIAARNPLTRAFIGHDISFHNNFPPQQFYGQVPQIELEAHLKKRP